MEENIGHIHRASSHCNPRLHTAKTRPLDFGDPLALSSLTSNNVTPCAFAPSIQVFWSTYTCEGLRTTLRWKAMSTSLFYIYTSDLCRRQITSLRASAKWESSVRSRATLCPTRRLRTLQKNSRRRPGESSSTDGASRWMPSRKETRLWILSVVLPPDIISKDPGFYLESTRITALLFGENLDEHRIKCKLRVRYHRIEQI